jgi:hypothetical protein
MFRIEPNMPESAYTTFRIFSPRSQRRAVSCAEFGCPEYRFGWRTGVDESTPTGQAQAHYIRNQSGRRFTEHRNDAGITVFTFASRQTCFRTHTVPFGDPMYLRYRGDHRTARPLDVYRHGRAADWVEDFADTQDKIKTRLERG